MRSSSPAWLDIVSSVSLKERTSSHHTKYTIKRVFWLFCYSYLKTDTHPPQSSTVSSVRCQQGIRPLDQACLEHNIVCFLFFSHKFCAFVENCNCTCKLEAVWLWRFKWNYQYHNKQAWNVHCGSESLTLLLYRVPHLKKEHPQTIIHPTGNYSRVFSMQDQMLNP